MPLVPRRHTNCRIPFVGRGASWPVAERRLRAMDLIIWLIAGGVVGWLASVLMHTDARQGLLLNVVVGIVGAAVAGFFISPLIGLPTINEGVFNVGSLLVSLVGAVILLAIVNLVGRGGTR
jgi:uncharacterized membrane protein YeaQ/YmgE (transglycosylase-associated protein family)